MIAITCPHCQDHHVVKFGTNRCGTARCRCQGCGKTFTLSPRSRAMTPQKEQAILRALTERISQPGIARTLKVGRQTIRAIRKKGPQL
jgi:transposase-like protein